MGDEGLAQVGEAVRGVLAQRRELLGGFAVDGSALGMMVRLVVARPRRGCRTCFTTVPKKPPIRAPQGLDEMAR